MNNAITPAPGKSLAGLLKGEEQTGTDPIFWEHIGNRAVRMGDWKLVAKKGEAWELYNLAADRSESNNLVEDEPQKALQLQETYEKWAAEVGVE